MTTACCWLALDTDDGTTTYRTECEEEVTFDGTLDDARWHYCPFCGGTIFSPDFAEGGN
jgi:hypothetical protein